MNPAELSSFIHDERKCLDYLRQVGVLKKFTTCTGVVQINLVLSGATGTNVINIKQKLLSERLGFLRRHSHRFGKGLASLTVFPKGIPPLRDQTAAFNKYLQDDRILS